MAKTPGIYKRGDAWAIVYQSGTDPKTGKYKKKWATFKGTYQEAVSERARLLVERDNGLVIADAPRWTLAEYLKYWLDTYVATNVDIKTETEYRGNVRARINPLLGDVKLAKLTGAHIRAAYAKLLREGRPGGKPLSARSVLHTHRVLREALAHAVKWQMLPRNVADAVDPPRPVAKEMQSWTPAEAKAFLAVVTERTADGDEAIAHGTAMALALETGCREGEVLGLAWRAVDFAGGTISIVQTVKRIPGKGIIFGKPKTPKSRRRIPLTPATVDMLRTHKARQNETRLKLGPAYQDHDLVFTEATGEPVDTNTLGRYFKRAMKAAGVRPIRFHDLRHTHASLLLGRNVPLKVVSERLGHASIAITGDVYSHVTPDMQDAAVRQLTQLLR